MTTKKKFFIPLSHLFFSSCFVIKSEANLYTWNKLEKRLAQLFPSIFHKKLFLSHNIHSRTRREWKWSKFWATPKVTKNKTLELYATKTFLFAIVNQLNYDRQKKETELCENNKINRIHSHGHLIEFFMDGQQQR